MDSCIFAMEHETPYARFDKVRELLNFVREEGVAAGHSKLALLNCVGISAMSSYRMFSHAWDRHP